ncbi:hypothetical protein BKA70DRAFT_1223214 [Coprinopsis sp. MPI-PUGE-AT-0042]|nr:hypothetical protein BKA70DRAFT_1223214 [Coprinopsis sp. MPI-PUGE-AT-0042]
MRAWTQIIASLIALVCASSLGVHALPISGPGPVVPPVVRLVDTEVFDHAVAKGAGVLALHDRDFNPDDLAIIVNLVSRDIALVKSKVIDASAVEEAASADDLPATPLNDRQFGEDEEVGSLDGLDLILKIDLALRDEVDVLGLVDGALHLSEEVL